MVRKNFNELFKTHPDGSLEPIVQIKIEESILNAGVRFSKGTTFEGIDFFLFTDRDFSVEQKGEMWEIIGVFK